MMFDIVLEYLWRILCDYLVVRCLYLCSWLCVIPIVNVLFQLIIDE